MKRRWGLVLKGVKPADEWQLKMADRESRLEDLIRRAVDARHCTVNHTDGGDSIGVTLEIDKAGFHFEGGVRFPVYLTDEQVVAGCQYRIGRAAYDWAEEQENLGND